MTSARQKVIVRGFPKAEKNMARELSHIIDTHLTVSLKPEKQNNKVSQRAFEKFNELLRKGNDYNQNYN